ncbi:MAG: hypothetical protein WD648_05765 [Planctomycetaceae bacterium]
MKNPLIATSCVSSLAVAILLSGATRAADPTSGPRFGPQSSLQVELGQQGTFEPPPAPAPITSDAAKSAPESSQGPKVQGQPAAPASEPGPATAQPSAAHPREEAITTVVKAQELLDAGQQEQAIELASRSIALDPDNAAAYKKVRAAAYQRLGRYSEALADSNPLEVTVAAPRAELKTKQIVIDVVTGGTKLLVNDVQGNWLKVASAGERNYEWAWIHIRDVATGNPTAVDSPRQPARIEYDVPSYYIVPPSRGVYIHVGPLGLHGNYGRDYYDYWGHVPPAYWGFLPR